MKRMRLQHIGDRDDDPLTDECSRLKKLYLIALHDAKETNRSEIPQGTASSFFNVSARPAHGRQCLLIPAKPMRRAVARCSAMSPTPPRHPLIAIVGATGTGKSQLAVSLAERFNGEIINGDALQMYEGLPITTNKMPLQERKGIPHHLLGCVKLKEEPWTIMQFLARAMMIIAEIRSRGRLPILVGGTHYYTQSLLFESSVVAEESEHISQKQQVQDWPVLNATSEEMLEELRRVDPVMAMRWHPKDRRKIRRSLEIYLKTGKKASKIYDQQRQVRIDESNLDARNISCDDPYDDDQRSSSGLEPPLRYDTLVFWNHASSNVLCTRLEERVESMISQGLFEEVASMIAFLRDQQQKGIANDQSRGIWVAVGFKELLPYFMDESRSTGLRQEVVERTKIATRQYAKRQTRWIRLRLQRALKASGAGDNMFLLDGTDLSQWSLEVEAKASAITADFLLGSTLPQPRSLSAAAKENLVMTEGDTKSARLCETCNKTLMSGSEWINHLKSKGHKCAVRPKIDWQALYPRKNIPKD